jgi:NAD(P)-dependent dehydrogenase (short-subunit alcohol dehydrogenase family)
MSSHPIDFTGRVAIVTGSGRGLGRGYALEMARRGARVVINDVLPEAAADAVAEIEGLGGEAIAHTGDITDAADRAALIDAAVRAWDRIDILINNAGVPGSGSFGRISPDEFDRVVGVSVDAPVRLCRAVWPTMVRQQYGRIVNITSHSAFGCVGTADYLYARAAHIGLTTALASDGREDGIVVNCVMPGAITYLSPTYWAAHAEHFTTEAAARIVGYLASEQCDVSGEVFHSAGGLVARVALMVNAGVPGMATAEDVRDNLSAIRDMANAVAPCDLDEGLAPLTARAVSVPATSRL